MVTVPNVLAEQANERLVRLWSDEMLVVLERQLWVAVAEQHFLLGRDLISADQLKAANAAALEVTDETLERIRERERRTRHDVKARLEIFCEDAGHERLHLGLTSADMVENLYALRIRQSMLILGEIWPQLRSAGIDYLAATVLWRGIKGAMGTAQDQADLLGADSARTLDLAVAKRFGFEGLLMEATGQVAHRGFDAGYSSRLLALLLDVEPPDATRRNPWRSAANGYMVMLTNMSDTWNEGDVWQSVIRRYAWPNLVLALDVAMRYWHG